MAEPGKNTERKLILHLFWAVLSSLVFLSVLFLVIGYLPIAQPWKDVLQGLGMVTLGGAIASVIHEVLLGAYYKQQTKEVVNDSVAPSFQEITGALDEAIPQIVSQVTDRTTESIDGIRKRVSEASDFLLSGISVLQGAKASGIVNIFPNRYSDCDCRDSVKDEIIKDIRSEKTLVRLMGISLGDYFLDRGGLHSDLMEVLKQTEGQELPPKIQAMLVDPHCNALKERARWEAGDEYFTEPAFFDSTTFIETDGAARIAKRLCTRYTKALEVRLYTQAPTAFLLLTSRFAFYEPYNYADRGSKVPLIQVQAGSGLYAHYASHFERIWNVGEPINRFDPLKRLTNSTFSDS